MLFPVINNLLLLLVLLLMLSTSSALRKILTLFNWLFACSSDDSSLQMSSCFVVEVIVVCSLMFPWRWTLSLRTSWMFSRVLWSMCTNVSEESSISILTLQDVEGRSSSSVREFGSCVTDYVISLMYVREFDNCVTHYAISLIYV